MQHEARMTAVVRGAADELDTERLVRLRDAMSRAGVDALVCTLPPNVLLLTGYWPVTARSVAIVHRLGDSALVVPEDEQELAAHARVDQVVTFRPSTSARGSDDIDALRRAASHPARALPRVASVGYEDGPSFVPVPYAAIQLYGASYLELVHALWPEATCVPAGGLLAHGRAVLTQKELARVRVACHLAAGAFEQGARRMSSGWSETTVAHAFREGLSDLAAAPGAERADGFTYCMSGPNAERASAAYQRSTRRRVGKGEAVLVHCNSYVDGYWTDITRTYCLGQPPQRVKEAFAAVMAARVAALGEIRSGVEAARVDVVVRRTLDEGGFGANIRHACGHGVGFAAIDHDAPPRLRSDSSDVLTTGMVMNVEPAVYVPDLGGVRHCDMVAVTDDGYELLTPFQTDIDELWRQDQSHGRSRARADG